MRQRATRVRAWITQLQAEDAIPAETPDWSSERQWSRFTRHVAGATMQQIAAEDGVTAEPVRQAVNGIARRLIAEMRSRRFELSTEEQCAAAGPPRRRAPGTGTSAAVLDPATLSEWHDRAMALADEALLARLRGDRAKSRHYAAKALIPAIAAAAQLLPVPVNEPTRAILYRSAASLALQAGDYGIARELLACASAGHPPPREIQVIDEIEALIAAAECGEADIDE